MATIHDPVAPQVESLSTRPNLRIVGLHIRGLRAIRSLDLPEDGLGWGGRVPDLVILGGINGSGKTTLLDFLAGVLQLLVDGLPGIVTSIPEALTAEEAWVDFQVEIPQAMTSVIRFVLGNSEFIYQYARGNCFGYEILGHAFRGSLKTEAVKQLHGWLLNRDQFAESSLPGVVYLPSKERTLTLLEERYKTPGRMPMRDEFIFRWNPPKEWKDSLEARLYAARWDDLNAKEEGRADDVHHFEAYSRAFERFFGETKRLKWEQGDLIVEVRNGAKHGLSELSSGEKQVIVLMAELLRHWRPGSLVLIDEPELHLHSHWQTRLWEALIDWQRERGGQVIVATQSNHLFQIGDPRTAVLLGGARLA
jgi:ABC-type transport system involved in cytochrome c biogenesis ATPase subunit